MTLVILFVLGTIVGSFLNVVGLRWDSARQDRMSSRFGGRSECPHCGRTLGWRELIPVLSFFLLRKKCLGCGSPISWQYPLVEVWTGFLFASLFYFVDPTSLLSFLHYLLLVTVFSIYVVITIYDFKHKIIPDKLVYPAIFLSILVPIFFADPSLADWLAGPLIFAFFASVWLFSRGRAMGFGDAKLGLSVGLLLGATDALEAFVLSFWLATLVAIFYVLSVKIGFVKSTVGLTMKSEVPFGPALVVGAWTALFLSLGFLYVAPI